MSHPSHIAIPAAWPATGRRAGIAQGRDFGLDLARCAAISLVLIAHFSGMFVLPTSRAAVMLETWSGILGVDLFFVLSGLLIGRLLLDIAETGPSLRAWRVFMVRRWLRTLPLYWLWLAVLLLVLPWPADWARVLPRFVTMTQNLVWPMPGLWFMVSWSLAVEEWFYLLFSVAFLGLAAWLGVRRAAWPAILLFLIVPSLWRQCLPPTGDYQRDVMTVAFLRLDAIAYGVALARLRREGWPWLRHRGAAGSIGLALVGLFWAQDVGGVSFAGWVGPVTYLNLERMATSVGLALVLVGLSGRQAWRPVGGMVRFGANVSYGVYLMHMTVIEAVLRFAAVHGVGLPAAFAACVVLTVLLPYLSFRLFENPILALRPAQRYSA